jgi:hypothetical protein
LALAFAIALGLALPALAQQDPQPQQEPAPKPHGFQISPAITAAETYDDDLAPPGANAFFTELTPSVTMGYGAQRWTLLSHGALDIESPDASPIHTSPFLRGTADLALVSMITDRLTLNLDASVWDTNTPRDLNVSTGIDPGNDQANSESADASLAYRFTQLSRGSLQLGFVSTAEGGQIVDEASARLAAHTTFSAWDGATLAAGYHHFEFLHALAINVESPLIGWDHHLASNFAFELLAGPRFDNGKLDGLEGAASLSWQGEQVRVSASLQSTQNAVAGFVGLVDTESALCRVVVRPQEKLFLTVTPALYISHGDPIHAQVAEIRVDAYRELTSWMALIASYRFTFQNAKYAATPAMAASDSYAGSTHNQLLVGVTFHLPAPGLPTVWPTADTWSSPLNGAGNSGSWREPAAPTPTGAVAIPDAEQTDANGVPLDAQRAALPNDVPQEKPQHELESAPSQR